jgi:type II secretion system protein H
VLRRQGFTLVEIVIVIFILLLILGVAIPSLSGVFADKRLHHSLDRFNELVREAHERALADRRAYLIAWSDHDIRLQPATFLKDEPQNPTDTMVIGRGDKWHLHLPAALTGQTPPEWIFWESGVCEPARVTFSSGDGSWTADYSPLTGLADVLAYAPR